MDYMELRMIFADRLKQLMADNCFETVSAFAIKAGVPKNTMPNWINMNRSPQFEYLYQLAKTLA